MNEFLEFLKTFTGKGVALTAQESESIAKQFHASPVTQSLYQHIFDLGHGEATKDFRTKEKDFNKQITDLTKERDDLKTKMQEMEGKTPDVQKVRDEMQGEIDKLNTTIKELKTSHKEQRTLWYRQQTQNDLRVKLIELGVDPDWAGVLVREPEVAARLKVTETEDGKGTVEVLKAGSETITLQGEKPLDLFAQELRKDVKPAFLTSKADGGGTGARTGGEGGGGDKSVFDRAREAGKGNTAASRPEGVKSGAERLGAVKAQ